MADLTPELTEAPAASRTGRAPLATAAVVAVGVVMAVIGLGLARVAAGWWPLSPDDARYLFVGLSVLDGAGAVTPSGAPYLQRSPVYGISLALGSALLGGDPLDGARVVATSAALLGLLGATRVAWLTAGPGAAAGTAVALAAIPIVWQLLPSLRIDLPQTALVVALLLTAWRPTVRRWAAAGVVLGLVVLVKETALPLVLLPLALVGLVPVTVVRRLAVAYGAAAMVTAGWWWVVVYVASGQVFPANALAVVEARDVSGSLRLSLSALPLAMAAIIGWVVVTWRARRESGSRLLLGAGLGLAPAAIYAAGQGLNARNFAAVAVLSAIAIGIGGATLLATVREQRAGPAPRRRSTAAVTLIALLAIVGFGVVGPAVGQTSIGRPGSDRLTEEIVAWVDDHVPDGGRIATFFREREVLALRRFGRTEVGLVGVRRVAAADDPATYLWMGLRDAQLFGYARETWRVALTELAPALLIAVSPHPFTPLELLDRERGASAIPGLTPVATLAADGDRADILRIDPVEVRRATNAVSLHLSADAALAWLDLAGAVDGADDAVMRLLAARPVVSGAEIPALLDRLGGHACAIPGPAVTMVLAPASTCPA